MVLRSAQHAPMNFLLTGKREKEEFLSVVERKGLEQPMLNVQSAILAPCGTVYGH